MNDTQEILLDTELCPVYGAAVSAKQGDSGSRFIRAKICSGGEPLELPAGTTARIRALKPDGYSVDNPAVVNDDGSVTAELTAQILAVPGRVRADIVFTDPDGDTLSTATFWILVEPVPQGRGIASTNEFLTLLDLIQRGEELLAHLEEKVEATMPTRVSELVNDSGYVTESDVKALINTALGVIENGAY